MKRLLWIATLFLMLFLTAPAGGSVGYFTTSDGVRLRFLERGEGRPVVMVAGWTMPAEVWSIQLDQLSADARVIAFDPRGQGGSEAPRHGYTIERRSRDLAELIEENDLRDVVLVGWSLGVFDVLGYLQYNGNSRVAGVVLIDGEIVADTSIERVRSIVGALRLFQNDRSRFASSFVRSLFRSPPPESLIEQLTRSVERVPADASLAVATNFLFLDMSQVVIGLDLPLLYLVTPQMTEQAKLVEQWKESAVIRVFEESGHAIFVDEAEEVNRLIRGLLLETGEPVGGSGRYRRPCDISFQRR